MWLKIEMRKEGRLKLRSACKVARIKDQAKRELDKIYAMTKSTVFPEKEKIYVAELVNSAEIYFRGISTQKPPYFAQCNLISIQTSLLFIEHIQKQTC